MFEVKSLANKDTSFTSPIFVIGLDILSSFATHAQLILYESCPTLYSKIRLENIPSKMY